MAPELRKVLFYACHKKFPTLLPFLNFAFELALLTAGVTGIVAILATKNELDAVPLVHRASFFGKVFKYK